MQCKWLSVRIIMAEDFWGTEFGIWGTEKKEYWGGMKGGKLVESGQ
jgi:hypothetical protein